MKILLKEYHSKIFIAILLFVLLLIGSSLMKQRSLNNDLKAKYNQLANTFKKTITPVIIFKNDSVSASMVKPVMNVIKNQFTKETKKTLLISDPYKDSVLFALNLYQVKISKLENENSQLKQTNNILTDNLERSVDTVSKQKKVIKANGLFKDAFLTAHLRPSETFDSTGQMIFDSSNFKYVYVHDIDEPKTDIVKRKLFGLPIKQEQINFKTADFNYSYKQPFITLQWQLLFNSSYRISPYSKASRLGINIGTGIQANTLGLNARLATFYNTTQLSGNLFQRMNVALQIQKPLKTFKIK